MTPPRLLGPRWLRRLLRPLKRALRRPDEYGIPELFTESSFLRFARYPAWWRHHLLRLLGAPAGAGSATAYLGCRIPLVAGIGNQLACWNSAFVFARRHGLTFVHHPVSDAPGPPWERFFGLGEGELSIESVLERPGIRVVRLPRIRRLDLDDTAGQQVVGAIIEQERNRGGQVLFLIHHEHFVFDQPAVAGAVRPKYRLARERHPVRSLLDPGVFNIGAHVRRGDLHTLRPGSPQHRVRWLDDDFFDTALRELLGVVTGREVELHVFSDSEDGRMGELPGVRRVHHHIDTDPVETFHAMVECDVLIISPSFFSYAAGIISDGLTIARHPWWHEIPQGRGWMRADAHGHLPAEVLARWWKETSGLREEP